MDTVSRFILPEDLSSLDLPRFDYVVDAIDTVPTKLALAQLCEQGAKIAVVSFLLLTIAPAGLEYACIAVVAGGALSEGVCVIISALLYCFDRRLHGPIKTNTEEPVNKKGYFVLDQR